MASNGWLVLFALWDEAGLGYTAEGMWVLMVYGIGMLMLLWAV
jgi:hypothetical protein